tara:strand:- start:296 stop:658 length:363 start_codon:yes stop_codon:yes gene_type:complete
MTKILNPVQAEKIINEYEVYGLEHSKQSRMANFYESELQKQKDLNLANSKPSGSVAKDKALANSDNNLDEIQSKLLDAQEQRDNALIMRNVYKMKFEKWKVDSFEKSNQEFFEKKVYSKT